MVDLSIPNKILKELAAENKFVTPVSIDDFPLFQSFFKKEKHTHGNSWSYIIQEMYGIGKNNLGYKYFDGDNLSAVCIYPKIEQPSINAFYWIRPMGRNIEKIIVNFSNRLLNDKKIYTYVKKIFKEQFEFFKKNGFRDTKVFPWHTSSPSEDDTYPEIIYDKGKSPEQLFKSKHHRSLRSLFKKMHIVKEKYNIVIDCLDFQKNAWMITQTFFDSKRMKLKETNYSTKYDYYNLIFRNSDNNCVDKKIIFSKGKPVGYYITELLNSNNTGFYALLTLRDGYRFISDYSILSVLLSCKTRFLNAGGSEDQGIHDYKMKFFPVKLNQMYWATNFKK